VSLLIDDVGFDFVTIQAELEAYVGVTLAVQPRLELWYDSIREHASLWLATDFTDDDGNDVAKPEFVKLGLFEGVKAINVQFAKAPGAKKVKTGQLEEEFFSELNLPDLMVKGMLGWLWPGRLEIQLS
jgi:hypothetical protein